MDYLTPYASDLILFGVTLILVSLGLYVLHERGTLTSSHRVVHGAFQAGLGLIILGLGLYVVLAMEFGAALLKGTAN